MVLELSAMARERVVLATVADVIVAAADGKALSVAVVCPDSQVTFVGHLARALHARGRTCRCLVSRPTLPRLARLPSADPERSDLTVVVITGGACAVSDDEVCRINIRVTTDAPTGPATDISYQQASDGYPDADDQPDIVLDYHDPSGPTIRHIAPQLSPPLAPQ
ncbi:hypothetical protein [Micromonospora sp. RTP1Z1]|uniref:hypothetical protein n=1 Tax=Micromonospora sp. RTP1Z1 TaxID=2994043 RepID=UPI0029C7A0F7|nr:hypothetical protein [Micromonospora sp. RTP1Z1]